MLEVDIWEDIENLENSKKILEKFEKKYIEKYRDYI